MRPVPPRQARRGSMIPTLALTCTGLFAFVALAIDLGLLAVSRTECQAAADGGSLAGARLLNNAEDANGTSNSTTAGAAARQVIAQNYLWAGNFSESQVTVDFGEFKYNPAASPPRFEQSFGGSSAMYTAVRTTVSADHPTFFAKIFGINSMSTGASAVAVHRPRDVAIVLDFSTSMQFGSLMHWEAGYGDSTGNVRGSLNPDPVYPRFGHYKRYTEYRHDIAPTIAAADAGSPGQRPNPLRMTRPFTMGSGEVAAPNNHTVETPGGPPMVFDFRFDKSNRADPSVKVDPVSEPDGLWNAFHRWFKTTPTDDPNGAGAPADKVDKTNAFKYTTFRPTIQTETDHTLTGGVFVERTFNWAEYNAFDTENEKGPTPAPANFADQSDSPVNYADSGGGDKWRPVKAGLPRAGEPAATLAEVLGIAASAVTSGTRDAGWEDQGDAGGYGPRFKGYSMGPGYYGKTFFMWPPDPRFSTAADVTKPQKPTSGTDTRTPAKDTGGNWMADWRRRFFEKSDGSKFNPQNESVNQLLLNADNGGEFARVLNRDPAGYRPNYRAVLAWLKTGPQTLPPNLRAGRVLYYSSIPNDCDDPNDLDKRFWREYIDYVLGYTGNTNYNPRVNMAGVETKPWPEGQSVAVNAVSATASPRPYMHYGDNPNRPVLHFWFGPTTMIDFLCCRQPRRMWWPGTCREAQCWQLKAAMQSALDDIRVNHPNDFCGMTYFGTAEENGNPHWQAPRVTMGQNWVDLKNALFYPGPKKVGGGPNTDTNLLPKVRAGDKTTEVRPYTKDTFAEGNQWRHRLAGIVPNANGGTDPNSGLAVAFNMLSGATGLDATDYPTAGRRGASKIVIFETDGVPNAVFPWQYNGAGPNSRYTWGGSATLWAPVPGLDDTGLNDSAKAGLEVVRRITAQVSSGGDSGLSLPSNPARVYAIGFGDLFSGYDGVTFSSIPTTRGQNAIRFLNRVQQLGNTAPRTSGYMLPTTQVITGPYKTRINNMREALERIMQQGVQVSLVE